MQFTSLNCLEEMSIQCGYTTPHDSYNVLNVTDNMSKVSLRPYTKGYSGQEMSTQQLFLRKGHKCELWLTKLTKI
jgi:hypothetical protein